MELKGWTISLELVQMLRFLLICMTVSILASYPRCTLRCSCWWSWGVSRWEDKAPLFQPDSLLQSPAPGRWYNLNKQSVCVCVLVCAHRTQAAEKQQDTQHTRLCAGVLGARLGVAALALQGHALTVPPVILRRRSRAGSVPVSDSAPTPSITLRPLRPLRPVTVDYRGRDSETSVNQILQQLSVFPSCHLQ